MESEHRLEGSQRRARPSREFSGHVERSDGSPCTRSTGPTSCCLGPTLNAVELAGDRQTLPDGGRRTLSIIPHVAEHWSCDASDGLPLSQDRSAAGCQVAPSDWMASEIENSEFATAPDSVLMTVGGKRSEPPKGV